MSDGQEKSLDLQTSLELVEEIIEKTSDRELRNLLSDVVSTYVESGDYTYSSFRNAEDDE